MRRTVRTLMMAGIATVALGGIAQAIPVYTNVNHDGFVGSGTGNTVPWSQVSLHADTTTLQYDTDSSGTLTVGDQFEDAGNANWTGYTVIPSPPPGNSQGLDFLYEITISWTGLKGHTVSIDPLVDTPWHTDIVYDSGSFDFYFKNLATRAAINYGATTGSGDDLNVTNGVKFMTVDITSGTGTNTFASAGGAFTQGASQLYGTVSALDPNYLFQWTGAYPGIDLNTYVSLNFLVGDVAQNTQQNGIVFAPGATPGPTSPLFTILSRHDGSLRLDVVPEPGTMILLGSGLLGLAGYSRKRTKKS